MNKFICDDCGTKYSSPEEKPPPGIQWDDGHICTPVPVTSKEIHVRLGIPDYIYTKEEYDNNEMEDLPENSYFIGYEDEDGNECEEDGSPLTD